jgi:putative transposase
MTGYRGGRKTGTGGLRITIESLNCQLRRVTKARGRFPGDGGVVKLLWLAVISIEDKGAREHVARRQVSGKRSCQPACLVEGQRVLCWREALSELDTPTQAASDKSRKTS